MIITEGGARWRQMSRIFSELNHTFSLTKIPNITFWNCPLDNIVLAFLFDFLKKS